MHCYDLATPKPGRLRVGLHRSVQNSCKFHANYALV